MEALLLQGARDTAVQQPRLPENVSCTRKPQAQQRGSAMLRADAETVWLSTSH